MPSIDLTLLSLYRLNGQESSSLPGLLIMSPPKRAARGREREQLIVSLLLNGNTPFTTAEYMQLASQAASTFYESAGSLTSAMRAAAENVNQILLERNLSTTGRGQYALASLTLAALRESQLTILQCGPTHVLHLHGAETKRMHDPALSGKGLGLGPTVEQYFSQLSLTSGDRLLLSPKLPGAWEGALESDRGLPALEATRKRLLALVNGDVNAALIQVSEGTGTITLHRPTTTERASTPLPTTAPVLSAPSAGSASETLNSAPSESPEPSSVLSDAFLAHALGRVPSPNDGPSAYAIPPTLKVEDDEELVEQLAEAVMPRAFPASIPRLPSSADEMDEPEFALPPIEETVVPRVPSQSRRRAARAAVSGLEGWRNVSARLSAGLERFLPRLLPSAEQTQTSGLSGTAMIFISILVPLVVVVAMFVVYTKFGRSSLYDSYLTQANSFAQQALNESDPVRQREAWENALQRVAQAEAFDQTAETLTLRQQAQTQLDSLLGVKRLTFTPAFAVELTAQISRMAASETDLYMLDATQGRVLRAAQTSRGYEPDANFDCSPGQHGGATSGPLVDLLTLPRLNTLNSTVVGVDAGGVLLYCSPGQVPQALPLVAPSTNWGRVTAFTLEGDKLYVLDAPSRAVWVYQSKDSSFPDAPYFYFGSQIPELQDAIDIVVSGDDLYLLHADGHMTHCIFSRIENVPTRCDSPVALLNPFPAYGAVNAFTQAHFTQMSLAALTDGSLFLLDADGQSVYRLGYKSFELLDILRAQSGTANPFPSASPFGAMTISPNHVLYIAVGGQVYVSNESP